MPPDPRGPPVNIPTPFRILSAVLAVQGVAQGGPASPPKREDPSSPIAVTPPPTYADVRYGPDGRNVMDVWLAPGDGPTPCVMHIHGGGWLQGDKTRLGLPGGPYALLTSGVSLVSINYRFLPQTIIDTGSTRGTGPVQPRGNYPDPPVGIPLHDAALALQTLRVRAREWNLDPARIAVTGGSAGACTALWLAFHDDLADPSSADPVARQSTKPCCVAAMVPQTTLDPLQILEAMPNATYGGHAFGYVWDRSDPTVEIRSFLADRAAVAGWIAEYSPYALVSRDDPPVFLQYGDAPVRGAPKEPTHSANYGALLVPRLAEMGVPCVFLHAGVSDPPFKDATDYLVRTLAHPR